MAMAQYEQRKEMFFRMPSNLGLPRLGNFQIIVDVLAIVIDQPASKDKNTPTTWCMVTLQGVAKVERIADKIPHWMAVVVPEPLLLCPFLDRIKLVRINLRVVEAG